MGEINDEMESELVNLELPIIPNDVEYMTSKEGLESLNWDMNDCIMEDDKDL